MRGLILTGATGFIGLNTLQQIIKKKKLFNTYGFIISIDKMGYATKYNAETYYKICKDANIKTIDCDINDVEKMNSISNISTKQYTKIDILDIASESHVDNSIKDPFSIYTQNATLPANLLAWIGKQNWKKIGTYWHISTDEVYSEIPLHEVKDHGSWFKITDTFKPNNPYSASKAAQDCFLMSLRHTFGLNVKFIRMANQFGKFQHPEKMLPASVLRVIKGESIKVYGKGLNVRQWTPVNITAEIIVDIMKNKIYIEDVIHIANRKGVYTNNQIVDMIIKIMKEFGHDAKKEFIEDRLGHDSAYALHTTPTIDNYFKKNENFEEHLKSVVEYYITNKDLYLK